ncbi:lipase family protein, partial [Roseburia faecis]|nr:lipase family protein [Roseburia faecis]
GEGKVHRGFYDAARQACTLVEAYMDKFHAGQPVLICGHSLGGAVALILAQMLRLRRSCEVQLYSYGAPRAADATFVSAA